LARERNRPAVLFERIKGDAATALHLVNGLATVPLDPAIRPGQTTMARLIVDACRPFARRGDFPATLDVPSRDTLAALEKKWPQLARIPVAGAMVAEEGFEPPTRGL
jgi:hypothetical protein